MARCAACETAEPSTGWLCEECAAAIHGATRLLPEQVITNVEAAEAVLIDRWGRPHPLASRTLLGRELAPNSLGLMDASISRRHAEILRKRDGTWWIVDLVSSNGTTVDDELVSEPRRLLSRSSVFFGDIGCYFVAPPPGPPPVPPRLPSTHRPAARPPQTPVDKLPRPNEDDAFPDEAEQGTFSGLRSVSLSFAAPTGGGGGVVELDGRTAQLTEVQYQLLQVLADRMDAEEGHDERVRGFVRSSELLATLAWDTARPEDNHIKQLVRRVRRTLVRAQIGDLIESRQGFGYRLRVRLRKSRTLPGAP